MEELPYFFRTRMAHDRARSRTFYSKCGIANIPKAIQHVEYARPGTIVDAKNRVYSALVYT